MKGEVDATVESCHVSHRIGQTGATGGRRCPSPLPLFLSSSSCRLSVVASRPLLLSRSPYRNRACLAATLSRLNTSFHSRNPPSAGGERARAHSQAVTSYPPRGCARIKEFSHSFFFGRGRGVRVGSIVGFRRVGPDSFECFSDFLCSLPAPACPSITSRSSKQTLAFQIF